MQDETHAHHSHAAPAHSGGHHDMDHMNHNHEDLAQTTSDSQCMSHGAHGMMAFHFGYCETILFEGWKTSNASSLIGSVIGIVIMAALYEGLKYYREYLFWKTYNTLQYTSVSIPQHKNSQNDEARIIQPTMLSWIHTFQTFLHILQIVLSYFLMLIFMTYNIWLCAAVVIGAAIGYFLFGWKKSVIVDVTEHCH